MVLMNKERVAQHRAKEKAKWTWKGGLICKICREKKREEDFRARGRGRETVCLRCRGDGDIEMRIWMSEQEQLLGRRVNADELREYLRKKACKEG